MKHLVYFWMSICLAGLFSACQTDIQVSNYLEACSPVETQYTDMVIPCNIAPLNFFVDAEDGERAMIFSAGTYQTAAVCRRQAIIPELKSWKKLLAEAKGGEIQIHDCVKTPEGWMAYKAFHIAVAEEPIDPYLSYRLIPPGYEMWHEMGIYQRNLENFDETPIVVNRQTDYNCMNCHSYCMQNPDKMMFHSRARNAGTILAIDGNVVKLDTKTPHTLSALVYPYWHPSGNFIACSVNDIKQFFHTHHNNRIEVMDLASDVVVYDIQRNNLITSPLLSDKDVFETFPTFSADGKTLYYCAALKQDMPKDYEKVRYNLCAVSFDASNRTLGSRVDTLYNAEAALKSVSFPRVSPDGHHLMFTLSDYGNFSIWHQEADLWMIDLETKETKGLAALNSPSVESYHSWSSNSRWVVFSSRRGDGLFTRVYITYIDADGNAHTPFILPQKKGDFYTKQMYSYNIPEMMKGPVTVDRHTLIKTLRGKDIKHVN